MHSPAERAANQAISAVKLYTEGVDDLDADKLEAAVEGLRSVNRNVGEVDSAYDKICGF